MKLDRFRTELRHAVAGQIRRLPVGGTVWPLWISLVGFLSLTDDRLTSFEVRFFEYYLFFFFKNTSFSSSYSVFNGLIGTFHKLMNIHFHVNFTHG